MEKKVFPKYDGRSGNLWKNQKLLSFAQAARACLPGIGDVLRAELRVTPDVKKSQSIMAQLSALHEIERAAPTEPDGMPDAATINRLIKLGIQQEKRPELFQKIKETQRAIENAPLKPQQKRGRRL